MRISDWSSDVCSSDPFSFGTNSGAGVSDIETLGSELLAEVAAADNLEAVEAVRVKALGKQGQVTALLKTMGSLSPEERQTRGPAIHGLREAVTNALAERQNALELAALEARSEEHTSELQ